MIRSARATGSHREQVRSNGLRTIEPLARFRCCCCCCKNGLAEEGEEEEEESLATNMMIIVVVAAAATASSGAMRRRSICLPFEREREREGAQF